MIPVNEPLIGAKEIEYVNECLRTGWISSAGRFIEEFEQKWAAYCGMKYGIAMSNGTTALQAAVGCGGLGHISVFSFYANKLITTGEGGMVLTNDPAYAEKARSLRNLCFLPQRRFYHTELGHNFRLTNLQAAIGLGQLERMEEIITKKRWMGKAYTERLQVIPGLQLPVEEPWAKQVYWMYGIVLDESTGLDAVQFAQKLKEKGVETRPFFLGMHEQPIFQTSTIPTPGGRDKGRGVFTGESYPVAERIARQGLYLPSGLTLTETQIDLVCDMVKAILEN